MSCSAVEAALAGSSASAQHGVFRAEPAREAQRAPTTPRARDAFTQRLLVAIRVATGLLFVACGLSGVLGFAGAHAPHVHSVQHGTMAFGGALLLSGALLPLLKGTEVIVETVAELRRTLGAPRA